MAQLGNSRYLEKQTLHQPNSISMPSQQASPPIGLPVRFVRREFTEEQADIDMKFPNTSPMHVGQPQFGRVCSWHEPAHSKREYLNADDDLTWSRRDRPLVIRSRQLH